MQKGYGPPISEVPGGSFEEIYPEKNEKFPRRGMFGKKFQAKNFWRKVCQFARTIREGHLQ